jgi:hypothetical protein
MTTSTLTEESQRAARAGKIIAAGWESFRAQVVAPDASPTQLREMRLAWFAGAQYLYTALIRMMDAGDEPTAADLAVMMAIDDELNAFAADFTARLAHDAAAGNG